MFADHKSSYDIFYRRRLLIFGLGYGAIWSLVPGALSDLLRSPLQAATVLGAGMMTGIVVTLALALVLKRANVWQAAVLGILSLPIGAWLFGLLISCVHWMILQVSGVHLRFVTEIEEVPGYLWAPFDAAFQYAFFSSFTVFAIALLPLAILTTLHLWKAVCDAVPNDNILA